VYSTWPSRHLLRSSAFEENRVGSVHSHSLTPKFNQPVVTENKPGANGVLGLQELLKAERDCYTLMVGNLGSLVINDL
jgi:tripartite-type tricarboxylate transporter receptor subunit TctC